MTPLQGFFAAISAIVLFYGLQGFSRELQTVGGSALNSWLERVTASRWKGFLVGALATAFVQSSSAITALVQSSSVATGLAILLVQQGTLPAQAAIPIVIGANAGSTSTAELEHMS